MGSTIRSRCTVRTASGWSGSTSPIRRESRRIRRIVATGVGPHPAPVGGGQRPSPLFKSANHLDLSDRFDHKISEAITSSFGVRRNLLPRSRLPEFLHVVDNTVPSMAWSQG